MLVDKKIIKILFTLVLILISSLAFVIELSNKREYRKYKEIHKYNEKIVVERNLKEKILNLNLEDEKSVSDIVEIMNEQESKLQGKGFCKLYIHSLGGYIKIPNQDMGKMTSSYIKLRSLPLEDRKTFNEIKKDDDESFYRTFNYKENLRATKIFNWLIEEKSNQSFIITTIIH